MPALASPDRTGFLDMLAAELAPREGRWSAAARITIATTITVAIAMVFRIPAPDYMAYFVFLITRDDRSATVKSALGGLTAVTLAIVITLALALVDIAEPALRLPAMALTTFAAMYTTRTFQLGPLTYLTGFVVVLLNTMIDGIPNPEAFTRATLWVWVVAVVPVAVTVLMHMLFGHDPEVTRKRVVRKVLQQLQVALVGGDFRRRLPEWRRALAPFLGSGEASDPAVARLLEALTVLEVVPATSSEGASDSGRQQWVAQLSSCLRLLETPGATEPRPCADIDASVASPEVIAFTDCLSKLIDALAERRTPPRKAAAEGKRPLFAPDAFSNPAHWQFALKTTAAVMICYVTYTMLDWPGIRTALVTCFFVALSSLGETVHKLLLRISGAVLGGLLSGLCIVFVLPHMTDVGQLCAMIALVSLGAAWIATSSEIIAYAGLQIAFAFFLGILQGYGPATDLTVLRDRIAGILLGNLVITLIFSTLWPESANSKLRGALSECLRALGAVVKGVSGSTRARVVAALASAEHFRTLAFLELRMLATTASARESALQPSDLERLAGAAFVATTDAFRSASHAAALAPLGDWMETSADRVASRQKLADFPDVTSADHLVSIKGATSDHLAIDLLKSEVAHVASA